jgi:hypothetical protein
MESDCGPSTIDRGLFIYKKLSTVDYGLWTMD